MGENYSLLLRWNMVFNKDCWVGNQDIHSWPGSATNLLWDLGASHFTSLDLSLFAKKKKKKMGTVPMPRSAGSRETNVWKPGPRPWPSWLGGLYQSSWSARPRRGHSQGVGHSQDQGCLAQWLQAQSLAPCSRVLQPRASSLIPLGLTSLLSVRCSTSAQLLLSHPTLCNPMDWNPPDSPVHGILQARILPCPPPGDLSWPRDQTCVSCIFHFAGGFLPLSHRGSPKVY